MTVPNGGGNSSQTFTVAHVWGSPYQQGYANGLLLADQISAFMNVTWSYIESEVETALIPYLPSWAVDLVAELSETTSFGVFVSLFSHESHSFNRSGSCLGYRLRYDPTLHRSRFLRGNARDVRW